MAGLPLWIAAPLLAVLLICLGIELKTGLILDVVTLPATAYFLIANLVGGSKSAGAYLVAAVTVPAAFVIGGVMVPKLLQRGEKIGLGAVKLLMAVAAALGGIPAFVAAAIFALMAAVTLLVVSRRNPQLALPSSPLILVAVVVAQLTAGA